jgi:hypothetical protein
VSGTERIRQADRIRRRGVRPATFAQRRYLAYLADLAGVEQPEVTTFVEASRAIDRLQLHLRQPQLEGFRA